MLYLELLKALYGTLRAARLLWEKLSGKLQEWRIWVNKMINGKQCTIGWHVDDVRCSYVDPMVVDHMIDLMSEELLHLGTKFDLTKDGAVTIDMSDHVKKIVAEMPEEMVGKTPTPAANHLFKIREGSVPIERRKPTRSIKSSCSCSISGNKDDRTYGLQYHSCASG